MTSVVVSRVICGGVEEGWRQSGLFSTRLNLKHVKYYGNTVSKVGTHSGREVNIRNIVYYIASILHKTLLQYKAKCKQVFDNTHVNMVYIMH